MSDVVDFVSVPQGVHVCRVGEVRRRSTRYGDPRLEIRWVVDGGEFEGHTAAWDALVFSPRGLPRARQTLAALGVDIDRAATGWSDLVVGKRAHVEVWPVEYPGPDGMVIRRNEVPYDGVRGMENE